jgi:hypothetical protein
VVQTHLPACFTPALVNGWAIVGVCLIRLEHIRPQGWPAWIGWSSENTAYRAAVNWTDMQGQAQTGVYIPRRDTSSCAIAAAGGRLFSGPHHHARFNVRDEPGSLTMRVDQGLFSNAHEPLVQFSARPTTSWPRDSAFASLDEASAFFEQGCVGYSSRPGSCVLDGMKLQTSTWQVMPLAVRGLRSKFFDNSNAFPPGSIHFDHALLMRDIEHQWIAEPSMQDRP